MRLPIILVLVLVCLVLNISAQVKGRFDCEYCGMYEGLSTKGDSGETNLVVVRLNLMSDSSYNFEVAGIFSWGCNSMLFKGQGQWISDSSWIYFKPDSISGGSFVMTFPFLYSPEGLLPPEEVGNYRRAQKYFTQGYTKALRIDHGGFACYTMNVRLDYDCLGGSWWNHPIRNRSCK